MSKVLEKWAAERKPVTKTIRDATVAIRDFGVAVTEPVLSLPVASITKTHVVAYKDWMVQDGKRSHRTIENRLALIRTLFSYALDNDLVQVNVADRVRVPVPTSIRTQRQPFSADDLKTLFSGPVHMEGARPRAGGREAAYWIPILALATGARLEELGQLKVQDVQVENGIPFLNITEEGEGQRLKTESSQRRVPLHPLVIELGFLTYVHGLPSERTVRANKGEGWVFPALERDQMEKRTGSWSKWFGRYLRQTIGITDRRKVFHSFRHTFKDLCRNAEITEEIHDRLTGHSRGTVGAQYGNGPGLKVLAAAVGKVDFGGILKAPA